MIDSTVVTTESMYDATLASGTRETLKLPIPTTAASDNRLESPFALALTTPDLENFITASSLTLSTSCTTPTPTQFLQTVSRATSEQEEYARGFEAALQRIQQQGGSNTSLSTSASAESTSTTYATTAVPNYPAMSATPSQHYARITSTTSAGHYDDGMPGCGYYPKSQGVASGDSLVNNILLAAAATEQIVPGTPPPPNPLDPQYQEELKKRRKKERNRLAASKCRKRRLEREADLEQRVKEMKIEYGELTSEANRLRQVVFKLKQLVMAHVNGGCSVMMEQAGLAPPSSANSTA